METPGYRLKMLRVARGFETATDAARAFGWNIQTYLKHESDLRGIKTKAAEKYAGAYRSSAAYILVGETGGGGPIKDALTAPLLGFVSAGIFSDSNFTPDSRVLVPIVPREDLEIGTQYSLKIDDNSVNLKIQSGELAICSPLDDYPGGAKHGMLVHVARERAGLCENTIKELRYTKSGAVLVPVSDDPRYQGHIDLEGALEDGDVRIAGVVIGKYAEL